MSRRRHHPLTVTLPLRMMLSIALALAMAPAQAELRFHWEDEFSQAERSQLTAWIEETLDGVERVVGPLPFDIQVYFHRRDGAREPVPWAHTRRSRGQGVHFHVDPAYPPDAFRQDWTAPHELSHLILPYLGRQNAWFAEGFASYMQYQVMVAMGVLTAAQAEQRYRRNLERAERGYQHPQRPFIDAAPRLQAERKYPTMYWGGAAYFLQVDAHLRTLRAEGVAAVLRDYLECCREGRSDLRTLIATLDRFAGGAFGEHLERWRTERGFPAWRDIPVRVWEPFADDGT